jgi:hypothetical protein
MRHPFRAGVSINFYHKKSTYYPLQSILLVANIEVFRHILVSSYIHTSNN